MPGFNFRKTLAYVTDPAGTAGVATVPFCLYPTITNFDGVDISYGYVVDDPQFASQSEIAGLTRDRSSTISNKSLAGMVQQRTNISPIRFRVDLPSAGQYDIRIAAGEPSYAKEIRFRIVDGSTVIYTSPQVLAAAGQWVDANGILRTSAENWTSSNQAKRLTFSTTTMFIDLLPYSATVETALAYLGFEPVITATPVKALVLIAGQLRQVTTGEVGTGLRPLVMDGAETKLRAAAEGKPLVISGGSVRGIAATETLTL